jgi:hypothetical protein
MVLSFRLSGFQPGQQLADAVVGEFYGIINPGKLFSHFRAVEVKGRHVKFVVANSFFGTKLFEYIFRYQS